MKIYARQVNPEYQESPILDCLPEDIALFGNRDYNEHMPDAVRRVRDVLDAGELARELEYIEDKRTFYAAYETATEAIHAYIPPEHKETYSTREIHALMSDIAAYNEARRRFDEQAALLRVLDVVTGRNWDTREIHGTVQGEWQDVYYISDNWSREALDAFEVEYFNTGSEWIVQDDGERPETPEEVEGFSLYCISWSDAGIRREIADAAGCNPDEVVMYKWAGVRRVDIYEEV